MTFNTQTGEDYARQLAGIKPGIGAILAIPVGGGKYKLFRDLTKRPAVGKIEGLDTLHSIFWADADPRSVKNLTRALQIEQVPWIAAFFPPELETELLRQEREKSGGADEDDIEETKFAVVKSADGYRPKCVSCTLKRKR